MPAPVKVNFNRVYVRPRKELLEVAKHAAGEVATTFLRHQHGPLRLGERRVDAEDVVLLAAILLVLLECPVRHNEVGEDIAGTPGVVALVVYRPVEDQISGSSHEHFADWAGGRAPSAR